MPALRYASIVGPRQRRVSAEPDDHRRGGGGVPQRSARHAGPCWRRFDRSHDVLTMCPRYSDWPVPRRAWNCLFRCRSRSTAPPGVSTDSEGRPEGRQTLTANVATCLLLTTDDGPVVVDVKPAHRLARTKTTKFTFSWTRVLMAARGWHYKVWSGARTPELPPARSHCAQLRCGVLFPGRVVPASSVQVWCRRG